MTYRLTLLLGILLAVLLAAYAVAGLWENVVAGLIESTS